MTESRVESMDAVVYYRKCSVFQELVCLWEKA